MRLLFIAPYVPSPLRVRTYQLLKVLAAQGVTITLVALEEAPLSAALLGELEQLCASVHLVPLTRTAQALRCLVALPTPKPLWVAACEAPELTRTVAHLVQTQSFDVAHVEHLRAASVRRVLGRVPCVLDAVDCITALQRQVFEVSARPLSRLLGWEEWIKLRHWEPRIYARYDRVTVTSTHDAQALAALGLAPAPTVISNGVVCSALPERSPQKSPPTLVFTGKLSYIANEDAVLSFAHTLWPKLKRECPELRWIIAGSAPSRAILALSTDAAIQVTGTVDDLRPVLDQASLIVCPLRLGMGVQNKALEAMARGKAVVGTPLVARGLPGAQESGGLVVAATDDDFLSACLSLLCSPEECERRGAAGRRFVEAHHRWEETAAAFLTIYRELSERHGA